ncbi:MAG TPA: BCCT family transporter, partial [Candidatus Brachybacterium intestinipullorum]|nr:BCCT family transporter [Candidatus Brachybacterium intestinipullorum]
EWAQVLPPEEFERREEDDEFDTDDYVVEPTFTSEVPVLTDPYEEIEGIDLDYQPEPGTLPSRTGSSKPDLPEGGRPQSS